jgi:hypothetical protein
MKWFLTAVLIASPATAAAPGTPRVPVLLELFTSEGCSSCPPADSLLESLDRQPVANADLIVVSEHVDYWNYLGWSDPYSSAVFSARQQKYSSRLATDVYTPQMVVDGHIQVLGSDRGEVLQSIARAAGGPKVSLAVHATPGKANTIHVDATGATANADLWLIVAADRARSQVQRGENGGRTLTHVAAAQSIIKIGKWTGGSMDRDVPALSKPFTGEARIIAVLTDPPTGKVVAVAQTRM